MASEEAPVFEKIDESLLVCSMCFEQYKNAKILPCQHSFCESCLDESMGRSSKLMKLECSICLRPHPVPSGGVSNLPNNLYFNTVVGQLKQPTENVEEPKKCTGCEDGYVEVRCIECSMFLCGNCSRTHLKVPSTKSHRIMSLDEYKVTESTDPVLVQPPLNCSKHPDQPIIYFCDDCDEAICKECSVIEHRMPDHRLRYFKDAATQYAKEMREMLASMEVKDSAVKTTKTALKETIAALDEHVHAEEKKVHDRIESIILQFRETGKRFYDLIKIEHEAKKTPLQVRLNELESAENGLATSSEYINNSAQYGPTAQLMTAKSLKGVRSQIRDWLKVETDFDLEESDKMEFVPSSTTNGYFEEMKTLGSLLNVMDASRCKIVIPPSIGCNQEVSLTLETKNRHDDAITCSSSEEIVSELVILNAEGDKTTPIKLEVANNFDGTMTLQSGRSLNLGKKFQVFASIAGRHIQDVPITIEVKPIRFHARCYGSNVKVQSEGTVASRLWRFNKGLVFSDRPVNITERISIKIWKTSDDWHGTSEFGFTHMDPNTLERSKLPTGRPDCSERLRHKPSEYSAEELEDHYTPGDVITFWVTTEGKILYKVNNSWYESVAYRHASTSKPVWAVFNMFGKITEIGLID